MSSPGEADEEWAAAIRRVACGEFRRVLVLGASDVGKSSFIRAVAEAAAVAGRPLALIDLDPGQKMVGPPGTTGLGRFGNGAFALERFIFIGSTSANELRRLTRAAAALAGEAAGPFIVNSAGFIRRLGVRLQLLTAAAVEPDLVVAIREEGELDSILTGLGAVPTLLVRKSPDARRKPPAERARIRQAALDAALERAERLVLRQVPFEPAPPAAFDGEGRPLCALADEAGRDMGLAVLDRVAGEEAILWAQLPPRPVRAVRLGKIWVERSPQGWKLQERLARSWTEPSG